MTIPFFVAGMLITGALFCTDKPVIAILLVGGCLMITLCLAVDEITKAIKEKN
jgi:hypothetical protein